MPRLPFQASFLLAPLAYTIHHAEEHLLFDFREWRLRYFADNDPVPTEGVLAVLVALTLVYLLLQAAVRTRTSVRMTLLFLMATQVHNVLFHLGGTLAFRDFSPGLITALLLYVPVNGFLVRRSMDCAGITARELGALFALGGVLFWGFEWVGPPVLVAGVLATWAWVLVTARWEAPQRWDLAGPEGVPPGAPA